MSLSPDLAASLVAGEGLLVPDRAAAVAVRLAYAAEQQRLGRKVWPSPHILTPNAFLRSCAAAENRPLLSQAIEWALLRQFARNLAAEGEVPGVSEIGQANALADAWQRSFSLMRDHDIAAEKMQAIDTPESRVLLRARRMLIASSANWGGAQAPSLYWPQSRPSNKRWRPVGFEALPRAWEHLLTPQDSVSPLSGASGADSVSRHVCDDPAQEVALAVTWARSRLEGGHKVLLVVPSGKEYESALRRYLQSTLRLDGGREAAIMLDRRVSLLDTPWVRDTLFALGWLCEAHNSELIQSGLLVGGRTVGDRAMRARLAAWFRRQSTAPRSITTLLAILEKDRDQDWTEARNWLQQLERCRRLLGDWRESRSDWPERLAVASGALPFELTTEPGVDAKTLQNAWQELLQEADQLGEVAGPVDSRAVLGLIAARASRTRIPEQAMDHRLHVLRSRRDPLVMYDSIWVCGLAASQWPDPVATDGWVPQSLMLGVNARSASASGRLQNAQQQFSAWRRACAELHVSQPARLDDAHASVSPLLRDIPVAAHDQLLHVSENSSWSRRIAAASPTPVVYNDEAFSSRIRGSVKGAVNLLDHHNDCPFRGSAEQRFSLSREEEANPGLDALESGSQMHELLHRIWREVGDSKHLMMLSVNQRRQLVESQIDAVLGKNAADSETRRIATQVQRQLLLQRAMRLLALESRRGPFRVLSLERKLPVTLAGCSFEVRIDRIDAIPDRSTKDATRQLVIDYKTGESGKPNWKGSRPQNIQLLLYRAALLGTEADADPAGLVTWHIAADKISAGGAADSKDLLPRKLQPGLVPEDWHRTVDGWDSHLHQLAEQLWSGRADLDPVEKACQFCPLPLLCRRDARLGPLVEDDVDADD